MAVVEQTEAALKAECRRSLHEHAMAAKKRGSSAYEFEEWASEHGSALIEKIGPTEFDAIVKHVWKLR